MKFFHTIRSKLFFSFLAIGFLPVLIHLLITYIVLKKENMTQGLFSFAIEHLFNKHQTLLYEICATLLISFLAAIYLSRPLRMLENITEELKKNNVSKNINLKRKDEIGKLTNVLNKIFERCRFSKELLDSRSSKLAQSEKKHRELLNMFTDSIYEVGPDQRISFAHHTEKIFGCKSEKVLGMPAIDVVYADDRPALIKEIQKLTPRNNILKDYKVRILTDNKDEEFRYCLLSTRAIFDKKGKFVKREGVLRDITPREILAQKVLQEKEKIEKMYANLHDSYLALGKINAQVAALAEINTTFSSNLDWKEKLHYIIESIKTFMQGSETLLFVQNEDGKKFNLKHASIDFPFWEEIELNKRMKIVKDLVKYRKPLKHFEKKNLLSKEKASAKNYQAMLAIPVIINNEVIGIFVVFYKESEKLKDFPTRLALAYTSQMSIALMMSGELDHSLKKIF